MTDIAKGQVWRLRTIGGPAEVRVVEVRAAPTRGRQSPRGRRIVIEQVAGAHVYLDDWREGDLTASPNAELISSGEPMPRASARRPETGDR